ncbi:MAG: virulence protein RhuM/Fic/DOC family protein [Lewinellaceae bacterium]|nr:virulence protein RhuM/Fic/DOC family protein [Lewinellaceae bacterium]
MEEVIRYTTEEGAVAIEVNLRDETVWLSQKQMAMLFDRDYKTISKHIRNIFKEGELEENSVVAKFATTAADGKTYQVDYYNLDVIISVGYRVKSRRGTNFRIWATRILRNHLLENARRNAAGKPYQEKYRELVRTLDIAAATASTKDLSATESRGILKVLQDYAYALETLDKYDHQQLSIEAKAERKVQKLEYEEAIRLIEEWRELQGAGRLFGHEKDDSFRSSLANIYQTFDGKELYPSIEEKAAHLLYFIVKNHSFTDGNKRIAAGLFVYFMDINGALFRIDGSKRIGDNALVAITIMIAESRPEEKDIMIKLVVNLINDKN